MKSNFYNLFRRIIRECNYTNTYKMAWAKALVEIPLKEKYIKISIDKEYNDCLTKIIKTLKVDVS